MITATSHKTTRTSSIARGLVLLLLSLAGCSTVRHPVEPPPVAQPPASDFTIAAGMLDTWNAIGQILVREDGVTYEGRSQMLGMYDVDYRGERFLVVARALAMTSGVHVMTTDVRVALRDGKPDVSKPAIALLTMLQARLPDELRRIAADGKTKQAGEKSIVKRHRRK